MAFEQNPYAVKITLTADSTLSATQLFRFVKTVTAADNTGTNSASVCTANTDRPIGVLQNSPAVKAGQLAEAEVTVSGVTKVALGGTVAVGDALTIDSAGRAVKITFPANETVTAAGTITNGTPDTIVITGSAAVPTTFVLGTALTAGVSGDIIAAAVSCAAAARAA
jgi:hypothetical protein